MSKFSVKPDELKNRAGEIQSCAGNLRNLKKQITAVRLGLDPSLMENAALLEAVEINVDNESVIVDKHAASLISISNWYDQTNQKVYGNIGQSSNTYSKVVNLAAATNAGKVYATKTNNQNGGSTAIDPAMEEYVKTMMEVYGFSEEDARYLAEVYQKYLDWIKVQNNRPGTYYNTRDSMHTFFANLSALYKGYSAESTTFWLAAGVPLPDGAVSFFNMIGADGEKLKDIINNQHDHCGDKRDFVHECVIYAVMSNDPVALLGMNLGTGDKMSELISFKGDVYSGSMGMDDIRSDISAINIYNRMKNAKNGDFWGAMTEYNNGVADGSINDVDEFLKYYGKGDTQKGLEKIIAKLDTPSRGTDMIANGSKTATPENIADCYERFINYLKENMS